MAETLTLAGLGFDTSGLRQGEQAALAAMNRLVGASDRLSQKIAGLDRTMGQLAERERQSAAAARQAARAQEQLANSAARVDAAASRSGQRVAQFVTHLRSLAGALGISAGFAGLVSLIRSAATAAAEGERESVRLAAALRASGNAAGFTAQQLEEMAGRMQWETLFDDEAIKRAMATLVSFDHVSGQTFTRSLRLAMDLSALFDGDLQQSALAVGKAMENPAEAAGSLGSKLGKLTAEQKDNIKSLQEQGRLLEAQNALLGIAEANTRGMAEALNTGLNKALADTKKGWSEWMEETGRTPGVLRFLNFISDGLRKNAEFMRVNREANTPGSEANIQRDIGAIGAALANLATTSGYTIRQLDELAKRESGPWTPEEQTRVQQYTALVERLNAELARLDALRAAGTTTKGPVTGTLAPLIVTTPEEGTKTGKVTDPNAEERANKLKALREEYRMLAATVGMTAEQTKVYAFAQAGATQSEQAALTLTLAREQAMKAVDQFNRERAQAVQSTLQKYREEAEAAGMTAEAVARLQLVRDGATEAELRAFDASVRALAAGKARAKQEEEEAKATKRATDAVNDYVRKLRDEIIVLRTGRDGTAEYVDMMLKSDAATRRVIETLTRERDALRQLKEEREAQAKQIEEVMDAVSGALENTFGDALRGQIKGVKDFLRELVGSFSDAFARIAAEALKAQAIVPFLNLIFGGLGALPRIPARPAALNFPGLPPSQTPVGVAHRGGVVGRDPMPTRSVPAALFSGAPRLHSGLRAGEFPAILEQGEAVVPRRITEAMADPPLRVTPRSVGGTASGEQAPVLNVHFDNKVQAFDAASVAQMLTRQMPTIVRGVMEAIGRSTQLKRELAISLGGA